MSIYLNQGHRGHPRLKDTWQTAIDRTIEKLILGEKRRYLTPVIVFCESYKHLGFVLPFFKPDPYNIHKYERRRFWRLLNHYKPYIKNQLRLVRKSQRAKNPNWKSNPTWERTSQNIGNERLREAKNFRILETNQQELNQGLH